MNLEVERVAITARSGYVTSSVPQGTYCARRVGEITLLKVK